MLHVDYNDRQKKQTYIFFDFECTQDDRIQCQQGYQSDDNEKKYSLQITEVWSFRT
jgi:hypothetical protein